MIEEPGRSVCWPLRALSPALPQKLDSSLLLEFGTECGFLGWRKRELRLLGSLLAVCVQELPEALQVGVLLRGSFGVDQLSVTHSMSEGATVLFHVLIALCFAPSVRGALL